MPDDGPPDLPMSLWPRVGVVPGARECLIALHGRLPLCIATNAAQSSRTMIETALDRVDLLPLVSRVFCFTEIGFKKSRPEFWHAVTQQLQVPLGQVVMVGDSLEGDVLAPRRFGLQTVWFNQQGRRPPPAEAVPTVTDLEQFAELVVKLVLHRCDGSVPRSPLHISPVAKLLRIARHLRVRYCR